MFFDIQIIYTMLMQTSSYEYEFIHYFINTEKHQTFMLFMTSFISIHANEFDMNLKKNG